MKTTAEDNLAVSDSEGAFGAIVSGDWFLVSPHMLIGAIGSVACFAWVFLALGSGAFASPSAIGLSGESGVYHLTFIVAFTISLLLSWSMAGVFSKRRAACLGVSVGLKAAGRGFSSTVSSAISWACFLLQLCARLWYLHVGFLRVH